MTKTRVLVVDDEVVFRHMVSRALADAPSIEVVATASDGDIALARLAEREVDVVTLDVDMPGMDGMATLRAIRARYPKLPVLMLSAFQTPGARELETLAEGADDCVAKMAQPGSTLNALDWLRRTLVPRIEALGSRIAQARQVSAAPRPAVTRPARGRSTARVEVLALGASTGGPQALAALLGALPAGFPVPVVIVQHMPPDFTRLFADRLSHTTKLAFREGVAGATLAPGEGWIAPGDRHMLLERQGDAVALRVTRDAPENSCRPAVDPLFRSVAEVYGSSALAVVLTGMGQDGLRGAERLREVGAQIVVQDEASSVVWGMPGAIAQAGLSDAILPLSRIATEIVRRVEAGRPVARRSAG